MRRILIVLIWACAAGALAFRLFSHYDYIDRMETSLARKIDGGGSQRVWFTPSGDLAGLRREGSALRVSVWPAEDGAGVRTADSNLGDDAEPIFAVAEDASRLARITPSGLRVEPLIAPQPDQPFERALARKVPVVALAFTAADSIAILYADGELELWSLSTGRAIASTHLELTQPGPLLSKGPYLAAYSPTSNTAFVLHTGSGDRLSMLEFKKNPPNIVALALSPQARFAVATADRVEYQDHSINAPGLVRAMAFYDRERLFAAGDFEGIYLLGGPQGPQRIAASAPGASLLAATGSRVAFGSPASIQIYHHKIVAIRVFRGLATLPWWAGLAILGLISPVAIYLFYGSLKLMMKKAKLTDQPPVREPEEEEGPIPHALIEACKNGDCVLWAGSGLSAQAGLPTWSEFLPELGKWAGRSAATPEALDALAAAADPVDLRAFLARRFQVSSSASQAHLLVKEIEFPALITTNFDNLLERVFPHSGGRVYTARDCADISRSAARREFFLLKPYGDLENPETIRLGPAQCRETVQENPAFGALIEDLFHTRTFLFLGADLAGLERDLGRIKFQQPVTRRHFALVPAVGEAWTEPARHLGLKYGIEALTYTPSDASHPEFIEFLSNLNTAMRKKVVEADYSEREANPQRKTSRSAVAKSRN